jgi:hypothetical protein
MYCVAGEEFNYAGAIMACGVVVGMPTVSASSVCGFMSRMSSIFFMK